MKEPNEICSVPDKKSPFSSANNKVPRGFQHQPPPTPKSFKFGNKFSSIEELGSRPSPAESKGATSDSEHTEASMRTSFIHNSGNQKQVTNLIRMRMSALFDFLWGIISSTYLSGFPPS